MALARVKTWVPGEVLTAADLNAEFNNILNNAEALVSPWPGGGFDLNGNSLILDSDADTLIKADTDDTIDFQVAGAVDVQITAGSLDILSGTDITFAGTTDNLDMNGCTVILDADQDTTLASSADDTPTLTIGATGQFIIATAADTRTNTVDTPVIIRSVTSGTPAAEIGTGLQFDAESQDENPSIFGQIAFAANDISTGTEDTRFEIFTRVAGATLTKVYEFVATAAFNAIFTHANTAERTYTFPDGDVTVQAGTLVATDTTDTLTNKSIDANGTGNVITNIGTDEIVTATGSATSAAATAQDVTMNDFSFFPSLSSGAGGGNLTIATQAIADPANTVGAFNIAAGGCGIVSVARWRYITSSDNPVIWLAVDPMGVIQAAWCSDDPTRGDVPGVRVEGCTSLRFTARDLDGLLLSEESKELADERITRDKMKPEHRLYRALQEETGDAAPSGWFLEHCVYNHRTQALEQVR